MVEFLVALRQRQRRSVARRSAKLLVGCKKLSKSVIWTGLARIGPLWIEQGLMVVLGNHAGCLLHFLIAVDRRRQLGLGYGDVSAVGLSIQGVVMFSVGRILDDGVDFSRALDRDSRCSRIISLHVSRRF